MGFREFVERGVLPTDTGKRLEPTALIGALVEAVEQGAREIYIASPRRAGKSSAVAQLLGWNLLCRPLSFCLCVAGSEAQAADVLSQKLRHPFLLRPNLATSLTFAIGRLTCPKAGSSVQVIAAREATAPGRTLSVLVVDEARAVDEESYEVLRPAVAGGLLLVLGTPGSRSHWWYHAIHNPPPRARVIEFHDSLKLNPELDASFVEAERVRLSKRGPWGQAMFAREWLGQWSELAEHPLVSPADVEACSRNEVESYDAQEDQTFVGVDLSVTRDLTSIATVARRGDALRLVDLQILDPRALGGTLPFELVEHRLQALRDRFSPRKIVVDAFQGVALVQRLQSTGAPIEAVAVTGSLNMAIFSTLVEAIADRRLAWQRHTRLESELLNLEVKENLAGWSVRDRESRLHRDACFAVALAAHAAVTAPRSHGGDVRLISTSRPPLLPGSVAAERAAEVREVRAVGLRRRLQEAHRRTFAGCGLNRHPHELE